MLVDSSGRNCYHWAAHHDRVDCFKLLLRHTKHFSREGGGAWASAFIWVDVGMIPESVFLDEG